VKAIPNVFHLAQEFILASIILYEEIRDLYSLLSGSLRRYSPFDF
jgi:hypothetical protein